MWYLQTWAIIPGPLSTTRYRTKKTPKNASPNHESISGGRKAPAPPVTQSAGSSRLAGMAASTMDPMARSNRMRSRMQTRYQSQHQMQPDVYSQAYQQYQQQHQPTSYPPPVYAADFSAAWDPQLFNTVNPVAAATNNEESALMTTTAPANTMRFGSVSGSSMGSPNSTMLAYQAASSGASSSGPGAGSYDYGMQGMGMMPSW